MKDVLKRLAELDSNNPNRPEYKLTAEQNINISESNVSECGMNYGSSMMDRPSTPASINITAGSGSELSSMLKDIMSLAGMSKHDSEPEPISTPVSVVEPEMGDDSTSVMRSVIDKLNPKMDEVENEGLMGGLTGAGIGLAVGKTPSAGAMGYQLGSDVQDAFSDMGNDSDDSDDSDDDDLKEYSNTPLDATEVPSFNKDAMVDKSRHNQDPAGHPQKGKRMNGTMPRAHVDDMYENLMRAYRNFVSETSK